MEQVRQLTLQVVECSLNRQCQSVVTSLSDGKSFLNKCVELSKYYKLGIAVEITSLCLMKCYIYFYTCII